MPGKLQAECLSSDLNIYCATCLTSLAIKQFCLSMCGIIVDISWYRHTRRNELIHAHAAKVFCSSAFPALQDHIQVLSSMCDSKAEVQKTQVAHVRTYMAVQAGKQW